MYHVRTTKTFSGNTAVQIVRYEKRRVVVVKHIGSAHNKKELQKLKESASIWIEKVNNQPSLFSQSIEHSVVQLRQYQYLGFRYSLLYESLYKICRRFSFHWLRNKLLIDLVIARIVEPGSKIRSIEFLKEYMGIEYERRNCIDSCRKFSAQEIQLNPRF